MFCRSCGYPLIGLPSNRCPECGQDFDPHNPGTFLARPRRVVLPRIVKITLVLLCLTLPVAGYFTYLDWRVHQESKAIGFLQANGARVTTYDATPTWAKPIVPSHVAWLWKRADEVVFWRQGINMTQCMVAVANLKSLRILTLDGESVTNDDLAQLEGLTRLQKLDLGYTVVTDAGLAHLKRLTALRWLCLYATGVKGEGLANLQGLTALHCLSLANTLLTDGGLPYLKGLTALQDLDLNGNRISDAGFVNLKGLTALQTLSLRGTSVTDAGTADLQKALPKCTIDGPE